MSRCKRSLLFAAVVGLIAGCESMPSGAIPDDVSSAMGIDVSAITPSGAAPDIAIGSDDSQGGDDPVVFAGGSVGGRGPRGSQTGPRGQRRPGRGPRGSSGRGGGRR